MQFTWKNKFHYKKIDSTQNEIWRLYEKNAPSGTLVVADIQIEGKGTHGRKWYTDEEGNIAFSFLIKPNCKLEKLEGITVEIAKIIIEIFKEEYKIELNIKAPNDIVYNKKKIGGILTQTKVEKEIVKALVIGIGINTNQTTFCKEIKETATSIKKEFNININTDAFIEKFCNTFKKVIIERIEN